MRTPILAGLILFVATGVTTARADEWTKKFTLTGKPQLRVVTDDADVVVKTGASNQIEARILTVGWRIAAQEVHVLDRQAGDRVELEVKLPRLYGHDGHRSVRVELSVPREVNPEIQTGDGDISMDGVKGETHLSTGDGDVILRSLEGALQAWTGHGDIRAVGRFDRLDLKTGDGDMEVELIPGSTMAASWSVRSGDGNVLLRLPEDFAADLDLRTGDGHIDLDFPVMVLGSLRVSEVQGKLNGGGLHCPSAPATVPSGSRATRRR